MSCSRLTATCPAGVPRSPSSGRKLKNGLGVRTLNDLQFLTDADYQQARRLWSRRRFLVTTTRGTAPVHDRLPAPSSRVRRLACARRT